MHIDWLVNLRIAYDTPQPMDVYIEGRCSVFHSERKPSQGSQSDLNSSNAYGLEHIADINQRDSAPSILL